MSASAQELKIVVPTLEGTYHTNARILSKYFTKYHPDKPTTIIQSVPGAFSVVATNYLYTVAPKDGSVIGTVYKDIPMTGVIGGLNINFDPSKFVWLGSNVDGRQDTSIIWANRNKKLEDEIVMGVEGAGVGNASYVIQKLLNLKFKYVTGYPNPATNRLALERNEVDAVTYSLIGIKSGKPNWLEPNSDIHAILQYGNGKIRHPEFQNVPTLFDFINKKEDIELANLFELQFILIRPFLAPPGIPADKARILRDMFEQAVNDPEYLAEAKKASIDVNLVTWQESEKIISNMKNAPQKTINTLRQYYETK
jgi:hypothetical protein